MELQRAITQISEIHAQVLRNELFRGYRAVPVAITSGLALVAAAAHGALVQPDALSHELMLWLGYAVAAGLICGADLVANCWVRGRRFRQQAVFVVSQFVPALVAGMVVTAALAMVPEMRPLLPGLWTMLYALGIFASLPYLPRALAWVAGFYMVAGSYLLWSSIDTPALSPWSMGLTFGFGQAAIAFVLHTHLERQVDGR